MKRTLSFYYGLFMFCFSHIKDYENVTSSVQTRSYRHSVTLNLFLFE